MILDEIELNDMAMSLACSQLEKCNFCPHEQNNNLNKKFYDCTKAIHYGIKACHDCIKEYFENMAYTDTHKSNKQLVTH